MNNKLLSVKINPIALALFPVVALAGCAAPAEAGQDDAGQAAAPGTYRTVDAIKESGTVKIGVFSDKAPFGYIDSDGKPAGYDVVYGDRIGKDLGVNVEYVPVEAASRVAFLETGKVDIILANFTVTDERAEKVDFANPYLKVSLGVASPDNALITDIKQLDGKNAIVVKGTTAETYLEANHPEIKLTKFEQYTEATSALLDGRGDAWVTDNTEALAWAKQNPGFTTGIATLGPVDTIAGAVTKGNSSLLEWLNQELVDLGKEQFFHADYAQTLEPVYGDDVPVEDLVVEGGEA
ncbi:MAG: cysteine ABC transporter substrate-binding protein [Propionibacteriaceae bacterium]|jgi:polar amino acid transport system substrate-binding protein|nr:cysteine ABC transporter substrate-binding protein [Propionibacteriaceae bacterium]